MKKTGSQSTRNSSTSVRQDYSKEFRTFSYEKNNVSKKIVDEDSFLKGTITVRDSKDRVISYDYDSKTELQKYMLRKLNRE